MLTQTLLLAASLLSAASAHFTIEHPEMRGDSFEAPASQWIYPCTSPLTPIPYLSNIFQAQE
jgi:hypothetical protein